MVLALGGGAKAETLPLLAIEGQSTAIKGDASDAQIRALTERLLAEDAGKREEAQRQLLARGPETVRPLLRIANRAPMSLALAIKELMPRFGPSAIEPLCDAAKELTWDLQSPTIQKMWIFAMEVMAAIGKDGMATLLRMFEYRGIKEGHYGACAGNAFAQMPKLAAPALITYLRDPREEIRRNAAALLAQFHDPRTVEALIEGLKSPDPTVRMYCARGLGDMREQRAIEPLLTILNDAAVGPRRAAAAALGKMYDPRFREPLAHMVRFGDERDVRETAANVLIHSGDPKSARLGRRYKPPNVGVDDWWMVVNWYVQSVLLTSLLVYFLIWLGAKHLTGDRIEWRSLLMSSWGAALGLLIFGFLWGCVFTGLSVEVERGLLFLGIPGALGFAWLVGPRVQMAWRLVKSYFGIVLVGVLAVFAGSLLGGPYALLLGLAVAPYVQPIALAFALLVTGAGAVSLYRREGSTMSRAFRLANVAGIGVFYLGYGIGWLALWGYLGL